MVWDELAHGLHALCLNVTIECSQSKDYIWQRSVSALACCGVLVGKESESLAEKAPLIVAIR